MRADHKCPDDPFISKFRVMVTDPEDGETYNAGCWDVECLPHVEFHWDQWMVCHIRCLHGVARGVACGLNFTECFDKAIDQYNAFDHSLPSRARHDGEKWGDYWDRVAKGPYGSLT